MGDIDSSRFPRLSAYVAALPRGLGSYPECVAKASVYRAFLDHKPIDDLALDDLPKDLVELITTPPSLGFWVSEARGMGIILALKDHHHGTNVMASTRWSYDVQVGLLSGPMYRALTALASPSLLSRGVAMRWGQFHRGTELSVDVHGHQFDLTLKYPPHLFGDPVVRGLAEAFRVVAELSRAKRVQLDIVEIGTTTSRIRVVWT
jgi:hypothetical protein